MHGGPESLCVFVAAFCIFSTSVSSNLTNGLALVYVVAVFLEMLLSLLDVLTIIGTMFVLLGVKFHFFSYLHNPVDFWVFLFLVKTSCISSLYL